MYYNKRCFHSTKATIYMNRKLCKNGIKCMVLYELVNKEYWLYSKPKKGNIKRLAKLGNRERETWDRVNLIIKLRLFER